jgi:hypothetical protein
VAYRESRKTKSKPVPDFTAENWGLALGFVDGPKAAPAWKDMDRNDDPFRPFSPKNKHSIVGEVHMGQYSIMTDTDFSDLSFATSASDVSPNPSTGTLFYDFDTSPAVVEETPDPFEMELERFPDMRDTKGMDVPFAFYVGNHDYQYLLDENRIAKGQSQDQIKACLVPERFGNSFYDIPSTSTSSYSWYSSYPELSSASTSQLSSASTSQLSSTSTSQLSSASTSQSFSPEPVIRLLPAALSKSNKTATAGPQKQSPNSQKCLCSVKFCPQSIRGLSFLGFSNLKARKNHYEASHPDLIIRCSVAGCKSQGFLRQSDLKGHITKYHPQLSPEVCIATLDGGYRSISKEMNAESYEGKEGMAPLRDAMLTKTDSIGRYDRL